MASSSAVLSVDTPQCSLWPLGCGSVGEGHSLPGGSRQQCGPSRLEDLILAA